MPSQTGIEAYVCQSMPPAPWLFHQDTEMYDDQQIVTLSSGERFADTSDLYKQQRPSYDFTEQVRDLQRHYTILGDDNTITELLEEEPALYSLLLDAVAPLQRAFGDRRLVYIRI